MAISPHAGKPAPKEMLVEVNRLEKEYFERRPDMDDPNQLARPWDAYRGCKAS